MNIIEIMKEIPGNIITHEHLAHILQGKINNINAKIAYMVKKGELLRLKKGLYLLGEDYRNTPINLISVANQLYTPSYVSFEYALSYYSLIPERVYVVTSAAMRLKKAYDTPIGRFTYHPVPPQAYALGVDWLYDNVHGGKLIATPEKALCDKIRSDRSIGRLSQQKLDDYLVHDLRIDTALLGDIDTALISEIAAAYRSSNLRTLTKLIDKRKHYA
jgi:hypothetical protein